MSSFLKVYGYDIGGKQGESQLHCKSRRCEDHTGLHSGEIPFFFFGLLNQYLIVRMEYGSHDSRVSGRRVRLLILFSISQDNNGGIYT